ncbi:MAG TPA: peptidoglycan-binding domain-containing protein [Nitrospiraceae bacterium]
MRESIDTTNFDDVVWLQTAIARLLGGQTHPVVLGVFDKTTVKMLQRIQHAAGLPRTGEPDQATLQHIQAVLESKT